MRILFIQVWSTAVRAPSNYHTIDPTLERALTLALIVFVRTSMSFSLEIDLHGRVPCRTKPTADASDGSESQ
jgi:hypothetical protein